MTDATSWIFPRAELVAPVGTACARTKRMLAPSSIPSAGVASPTVPIFTRKLKPKLTVEKEPALMADSWVYERSADGSARFVLGTVGENPLVCFGINPSTAVPNALDPTLKRVRRFAAENGYDSWTMLNGYPQIATNPKDLDRAYRPEFKVENERQIDRLIDGRPLTFMAAWGGLVTTRPYFPGLLADILQLRFVAGCDWVSLGDPTKNGHPFHPLYRAASTELRPFSVDRYVSRSSGKK